MKSSFRAGLALVTLLISPFAASAELEIQAGDVSRRHSIVMIENPDRLAGGSLRSTDGKIIALQKTEDGKLAFILPELAAGEKICYRVEPADPATQASVLAERQGDQIHFTIGGRPVTTYQAAAKTHPRPNLDPKFLRGGYLHPVVTPSGKTVSDDYAVNHLHHHGIWMAWTKARYNGRETDFWNMGQGKGKVDFVSLEKSWSGPVQAGLISHHRYTDLTSGKPVDALDEKWTVTVHAAGDNYHVIDVEAEQTPIGGKPLELPAYHYGGLGLRGLEGWNGKDNASFVTSETSGDRTKANGQPVRWLRMSGKVDGGSAGIAVLSHPSNFRSPQPARIHPSEPFVSLAPQIGGDMEIKAGETYRMKYRFIISDGEADSELLERLWQDYAHPAIGAWKD